MPGLLAGRMGETDTALISPEDASRLGVSSGDKIAIEVGDSRMVVMVRISNHTLKGVVVVHWDLVRAALSLGPLRNFLVSRACPCRIRRDEM
jgi:formate dehydrogenase major subunit